MSLSAIKAEPSAASSVTRLAIVGLGLVGQRHASAIGAVADVELVAVVDQSEPAQATSANYGVPCFADMLEMISSLHPDGIILATPTRLHSEQALACIDAGIPVLVEKPLSDDLVSAQELIRAARESDVTVLVGHHRRHNPIIKKAHSMIAAGSIGKVRAVHASCWFYKPDDYFEEAPWRKLKGAGPISVNVVHDVDLIRHLCGEVVTVQAHAAPSERGFENEDVAGALLQFENGAIGTITVSDSIVAPWSWEMTSKEYPIYPATDQFSYMIGGSEGSLSIPDLTLWTHPGGRDWWSPISATAMPGDTSDPLVNQIAHFAQVIAGTSEPLVSGEEGLRTLQVVDAIQRSSETGETIRLEP